MQKCELYRHGTVYDVYRIFDGNGQVVAIKKCILNIHGLIYLEKECRILNMLIGRNGFAQLKRKEKEEITIEYIKHKGLSEKEWIIALEDNEIHIELAERLAEFNAVECEGMAKDNFAITSLKTGIKGILEKKFGWSVAFKILQGICISAVRKKEGVLIHGDFNFGNILLGEDNRIYIIDYDRTVYARNDVLRDCLELVLSSGEIVSWTWQYDFIAAYLKNLQKYKRSVKPKIRKQELICLCIRLCAMYFYCKELKLTEENRKKNLQYLIDKKNCDVFYDRFKIVCNEIGIS